MTFTHRVLLSICLLTLAAAALPGQALSNDAPSSYSLPNQSFMFGLPASGGTPPYNWSVVAGSLPPGVLVRNESSPSYFTPPSGSNGWLGGTPNSWGGPNPSTYTFTLRVTDSAGATADKVVTFTTSPMRVEVMNLPDAYEGQPYSYTLKILDAPGPVTFSLPGGATLPAGLSLNPATGEIYGTPQVGVVNAAGLGVSFYPTILAHTASFDYYFGINFRVFKPRITTDAMLAGWKNGVSKSVTLTATGGTAPYTWSAGCCMPGNVTLSPAGVLSGISYSDGGSGIFITATDANGYSTRKNFFLHTEAVPKTEPEIQLPFSPDNATLQDLTTGSNYQFVFVIRGGIQPFTWTVASGSLPPGMSLSNGSTTSNIADQAPGTAYIYGTPSQPGDYTATIALTDSSTPPSTATRTITFRVRPMSYWDPYWQTVETSGTFYLSPLGSPGPFTCTLLDGRLPLGLTLGSTATNCTLSGTLYESSVPAMRIQVTDGNNSTFQRQTYLNVGSSLRMSAFWPSRVSTTASNNFSLNAWGGSGNYTWSLQPQPPVSLPAGYSYGLPPGFSLTPNGTYATISGTAGATPGKYIALVRVAEAATPAVFAQTAVMIDVVSLNIQGPCCTLPWTNTGGPVNASFTAGGASGAVTWSLSGNVPPGISVNPSTGVVNGSPSTTGQFNFTLRATDAAGYVMERNLTLSVYAPGLAPPLNNTAGGNWGTYSFGSIARELTAAGGSGSLTWSLAPGSGPLPAGFRIVNRPDPLPSWMSTSSYGGLLGVPTIAGTYNFVLRVTDSLGVTSDSAVTMTITPLAAAMAGTREAAAGRAFSTKVLLMGSPTVTATTVPGTPLPAWLSLATTVIDGKTYAVLSGTPTAGSFNPMIRVSDGVNPAFNYSFNINATRLYVSAPANRYLPNATINQVYNSGPITVGGGSGNYTFSLYSGSLPPGAANLNSSTGAITGTPTSTGNWTYTMRVVDNTLGDTVNFNMSLTVLNTSAQALSVGNQSLSHITIGNEVNYSIQASGGTPPYTYSFDPAMPPPTGVSLYQGTDGVTSSPSWAYLNTKILTPGAYAYRVKVTDSLGATGSGIVSSVASPLVFFNTSYPTSGTVTVNAPISQKLLVAGGTGSYTFAPAANTPVLPGLTLAGGVISGSLLSTGNNCFTIRATDSASAFFEGGHCYTAYATTPVTLQVSNYYFQTYTPSSFTTALSAASYSGGSMVNPITWQVAPGTTLPDGVVLLRKEDNNLNSTSSTGVLNGALAPGSYTAVIQVRDANGNFGQKGFLIKVGSMSLFNNSTLPFAYAGTPYTVQLKRSGGTGPFDYSVTAGSLPPGISLSASTGAFSGTPTTAGTYSFTVTLTDTSNGETYASTRTIQVYPFAIGGPDILPAASTGKPYSYTFTAPGGPYTWTMSQTPLFSGSPTATYPGLTLSTAGILSGTPYSCTGNSSWVLVNVTATAGATSATRSLQIPCRPEANAGFMYTDATATLADATVNVAYSYNFTVRNGAPPYTASLTGSVPPGLSLMNPADLGNNLTWSSLRLTGTPTATGSYTFNLNVTDSAGLSISTPYTLVVSALNVAQNSLPAATYNVPYTQQLVVTRGSGPCSFSLNATSLSFYLPDGLSLSSSGLITGTPKETGAFNFQVLVSGCSPVPRNITYALTVYATGTRLINLPSFQNPIQASSGYAWTGSLTPSGGSGVHTWTKVTGVLPTGIREYNTSQPLPPEIDPTGFPANTLFFYGPPTTPGSYSVTYRVDDQTGNFGVRTARFYIPPMNNSARLSAKAVYRAFVAKVGQPISINVVPAGGAAPYSFSTAPDSNMPPWLSLNPSTGVLSGTPTAPTAWTTTILITDANGWILRQQISLYIFPAAAATGLAISPSITLPATGIGDAYSTDLDPYIQAGVGPYSWALVSGLLPPGLSLSGNKITGAANVVGDYNFVLELTDTASGAKWRIVFYLTVNSLSVTPLAQNLPQAVSGVPYTYTLAGANGAPPYSYYMRFASSLPMGLSLNSATGVLSGTPLTTGIFRLYALVRDAASTLFIKEMYLQVLPPGTLLPALSVSPASLTLTVNEGSGVQTPVPVNVGATTGALSYSVSTTGGSWLSASSSSGTTPSTFNINLNATGLTAAGSPYLGSVTITSAAATNSPKVIPVTLTVTAPPPCTYSLSPGSVSYTSAGGSGTVNLSTGATCAWAASSSAAWLKIVGPGSGTGANALNYTADPNTSVSQRTATLSIGGAVFTVTQLGTAASFTLTQSAATVPATGGVVNVNLVASAPDAAWTATVNPPTAPAAPFLTLQSAASGTGGAVVSVQVAGPNGPSSRTQSVTVGGQTLTITQQGLNCTYTLIPTQTSLGSTGGATSVDVVTPAGCAWTATPSAAWIGIASGSPGSGNGTVSLNVAANSSTQARSANVVIGDQTFPVTQSGVACSFSLSANNPLQPAAGGTGTIDITANGSNCSWVASSNAAWLTLSSNTGTGNATLTYTAASTSEVASRSASLTIAGQNIVVNQSGIACTYNLRSPSATFPAIGGAGSNGVITPAACGPWSVSGLQSWITLTSPASGNTGPSEVQFTVANNTTAASRSAAVTIAGQTFTVTQDPAPCSISLTPPITHNATELGGASSFAFTTGASGCNVPISSMSSWIQVTGSSLIGTNGTVNFNVSQNGAGARSGTILVGNQTFTVNQAATSCSYTLAAYSATTNSAGGPAAVGVTYSSAACLDPSAVVTPPGSVTSIGFSGVKPNMNMGYTVTPFTSLTPFIRSLQVDVGNGQYFSIKQTSW